MSTEAEGSRWRLPDFRGFCFVAYWTELVLGFMRQFVLQHVSLRACPGLTCYIYNALSRTPANMVRRPHVLVTATGKPTPSSFDVSMKAAKAHFSDEVLASASSISADDAAGESQYGTVLMLCSRKVYITLSVARDPGDRAQV